MKDYYEIIGVKKDASQEEIETVYKTMKNSNQLSSELYNIFSVLTNVAKRKKYDELCKKIELLTSTNISYFGYDFDEKNINSVEYKKYLIDNNRYLIYEKEYKNGQVIKKYYIENNGKLELISENKIKKIKEVYYSQNSHLLKDTLLNKVLSK